MNNAELTIPRLGESISSVQLIRYMKKVGEYIEVDEIIAEVTTDKVDAEIPSRVSGRIVELRFQDGDKMEVGAVLAIIEETSTKESSKQSPSAEAPPQGADGAPRREGQSRPAVTDPINVENAGTQTSVSSSRDVGFLSPLVRKIIQEERISESELRNISGTGRGGRISKNDVLRYLQKKPTQSYSGPTDLIEMDNMRRIIAQRMKQSKHVSPHVTAFVEADVTDMIKWREENKAQFLSKYGQKLTVTPLLVEATAKAIQDYPMINTSVDETESKILRHHHINIGIATELPNGNLIVPVIKQADQYKLSELSAQINEKVQKARNNKLSLDDVQGGTFTISNVGTFGNVMGTPIINQPEVAILATGVIKKKPAVLETPAGDVFAVRQFMFLSLSFDHRIVDGSLGGRFLKRIADYLENWDLNKKI